MATVLCICKSCNSTYYCKDELYIFAHKNNMRLIRNKQTPITWQDWLEHISSHCDDCRLKIIPSSCLQDYENQTRQ